MDAAIRISIDGRGAQTGARDVNNALDSMRIGMDKADRSMGGVTAGLNAFKGIMGSIGVAFGVKEAIMLADSYNTLQSRIKTATKATGDYEAVSRRLFDISQANGISLKSTVSTFQSIARGAGELGKSNAQIITFVSTLQKLGTIGGSSAQEMEDGLRQLSQGLSGGIIRAEEWNSIVENTPEIAVRAARGIEEAGGSIGKLRKIMLDGKLTAQVFFDAIAKQAPEIEKEFASMPVSVERAMTALSNATQKAFGDLDKQIGGGTSALAQGMMALANNMEHVAQAAAVLGTALIGTLVGRALPAMTSAISLAIASQTALVSSMGAGTAAVAGNVAATKAKTVVDIAAAQAAVAAATANVQTATAAKASAMATFQAAKAADGQGAASAKTTAALATYRASALALYQAQQKLTSATAAAAAASTTATVAVTRMGFAARLAAGSMGILKGAMAFFGGPIGAAITGLATGIMYLRSRTQESDKVNEKLEGGLQRIQDINMSLVGSSGDRANALRSERDEIIKNAEAELALVRAKEQAEGEVSTARRIAKLPIVGLRKIAGFDPGENEGDVASWTKRREELEKVIQSMRETASQEIPQLAPVTVSVDEESVSKAEDAAESYKKAVSDIINETSRLSYMNQQFAGGEKATEEAGIRYDLMEKAKEAGMYTSAEVENIKQVAAEYRRVSEEADNLRQAEEEKNDAIQRSDEIWRDTLSPLEEYQIQLAELQDLHQQWIDTNGEVGISQSTLAAATAQLRQEVNNTGFGEAIDPVTKYKDELQKLIDLHQLFLDSNGEIGLSVEQLANAQTALAESMNSDAQQVFDDTRTSAEKYAMEVERLTQLHKMYIDTNGALGISQDTFNRALEQSAQSASVAGSGLKRLADEYGDVGIQMEKVAMGAALNLEDSLVDIATGAKSAKDAFADFARSTAEMLMRTAIQMAIIRPLLMGLGAGFAGGGVMTPSGPMSLPMYAKGGIMSKLGDVPLKTYSSGGVANSPQIAVFGEGRQNEAYVPLPDGRRIPVAMEGGGQGKSSSLSIVNNINVNMPQGGKQEDGDRFGQAIARQVEDAMNANLMKQQRPGGLLDPYGYGT